MTHPAGVGSEQKKRGVGFPQLPLRESVSAIIILGQHGPAHGQDAAAAYLGHSTANSGAFRTKLAALRDWGLLVRGDKDRVLLSELAQRLVLEAPDHEKDKQLLLAAFESCRIFGTLYNDSAKDTPLDLQRLRNVAVMRYSVASDQADKFVECFIDSVAYAGLGSFDGTRVTLIERDAVFSGRTSGDAPGPGQTQPPDPAAAVSSESDSGIADTDSDTAPPVALRQAWPIDGGEIEFVIRTSMPLPPSIYVLVAKMAEVARDMAVKLAAPETGNKIAADLSASSDSALDVNHG
jgi:hypothetical protein